MVWRAVVALVLALAALPLAAREAPGALNPDGDPVDRNPLAGYRLGVQLPALTLRLEGSRAIVPDREATLLLDGQPAAYLPIPGGSAELPRRAWTGRDYLITAGVSTLAALLGAAIGATAVALH